MSRIQTFDFATINQTFGALLVRFFKAHCVPVQRGSLRALHALPSFFHSVLHCLLLLVFHAAGSQKKNAKCETKVLEKKWSERPLLTLSPFSLAAKRVNHQAALEFKPTSLPHNADVSLLEVNHCIKIKKSDRV